MCVSGLAHVTNGGSGGMMSAAGLDLPYPWVSQAKFRDETFRRRKYCYVCQTLICKLVFTFGYELAFHRQGLCVSGLAHVTYICRIDLNWFVVLCYHNSHDKAQADMYQTT